MSLSSYVYMLMVCAFVWGGFLICLGLNLKNQTREKKPGQSDGTVDVN